MTKKLEIVWVVFLGLAAIGVVVFWCLDWHGHKDAAAWSLVVAAVFGYIALGAKGLAALRHRNGAIG